MTTLAILSIAVSFAALGFSVVAFRLQAQARAIAQKALDLAQQAGITPAGSGGPRPKPASTDEPDMRVQADGGPRPKV
jgi:hypothetical protein